MTSVLLAISGGISAYKTPELVRLFRKQNIVVKTILSKSAETFVTAATLSVVSEGKTWTDIDFLDPNSFHLKLSRSSDVLLIAPATANTIAKFAYGIADNLLTTLFLSFKGQIVIAPAMHTEMWENSATQENIAKLRSRGVWIIEPETGDLACGDKGIGRLADLNWIVECVQMTQYPRLNLQGKKVLITSGGTVEEIDPVRVITNKSTGKLGLSLAKRAHFEGADVRFLSTSHVNHPGFSKVITVSTVASLDKSVNEEASHADVIYMAAAVSDFSVKKSKQKLSRQENLNLDLEKTPDILASLIKDPSCLYIGFCLADESMESIAKEKLKKKGLDYIVGNSSQSFGKDIRTFKVFSKDGNVKSYEALSLHQMSEELLSLI
ncbi:bifunctional phosphopantothenoylcysteine decarboxylase/phosphopantothenate--cysteine ligase CoaBC [Candidatus Marinamargulisbacteria bacterium SCGC AAA071-K20]|nr:bifunctional phosphopantothenoylcysteine decarboxylase/phosphopantothenate--cysteine ligase CoaBC [Candidatus Marinamargulisbacteria bacterium SCGC AAA071-K20]